MAEGSPTAGMQVDGAELARRMIVAAEAAASAAQSTAAIVEQMKAGGGEKDWFKLLPKPGCFEPKSREQEVALWKDWWWTVLQYLGTLDPLYITEVETIEKSPNTVINFDTMPEATRKRSVFLYGLFASLLKGRLLTVLRGTGRSNGYEALRMLLLQCQPSSRNRSLGILNVLMSFPYFDMKSSLLAQVVKLEEGFREYDKIAQQPLATELKFAVLLRCISGQLRTHINVSMKEDSSYEELREMILQYDRATIRWTEAMSLGSSRMDGPVPMEIDRIASKGKYDQKGKGKNKGKSDRSYEKGKGKGKDERDKGKGKYGGKQGGKQEGKHTDEGKGKGVSSKASQKGACFTCGRPGHLARDCWQNWQGNVRYVQNAHAEQSNAGGDTSTEPPSNTPMNFAPANTSSSSSQVGTAKGGPSRIARITVNSEGHFAPIFDLRNDEPNTTGQCINAIQFYIGDSEDEEMDQTPCVEIRMARQEGSEEERDEEKARILIDSGADAAVFPTRWAAAGEEVFGHHHRLQDAQGSHIPTSGVRDVEVELMAADGRPVIFRERVVLSDKVSQPILCYGKLFQQGWGISPEDSTLVHGGDLRIPVELQNRSIFVEGKIRVVREEADSIRTMTAVLQAPLRGLAHGWSVGPHGFQVGLHIDSKFQDPLLIFPDARRFSRRTTLVETSPGNWEVKEFGELLEAMDDRGLSFGEEIVGLRPMITILTSEEETPEAMGFDVGDLAMVLGSRDPDLEIEEVPVAPEELLLEEVVEEEDVRRKEEGPRGEGDHVAVPVVAHHEPVEGDRILIGDFNPEKVTVNGIEMKADSTLAVLRQASSFLGIARSGSKRKCYGRIVAHLQKLELQAAKEAAEGAQIELYREAVPVPAAQNSKYLATGKASTDARPIWALVWGLCYISGQTRQERDNRRSKKWWHPMRELGFLLHSCPWRRSWGSRGWDCSVVGYGLLANWVH